jgi:predicted Fe-Mo cluster-binding NifX family protein
MKVGIPSNGNRGLDETVGEHFGRVRTYTIYDTETKEVSVIDNTSAHAGGSGYPPELLHGVGVETMLCSGLGRRAIGMFEQMGIMVYVGAYGKVVDAIKMWEQGKLQPATDANACSKHAFRGEGFGEGHGHGGHC